MSRESAVIRPAAELDAPVIAEAAFMAGHGMFDLMFDGLLPGRSAREAYCERRVLKPGHFSHWSKWFLAENPAGQVVGALNLFPHAELLTTEPDPLLTRDRLGPFADVDIEECAVGSYYLNVVAIFPAFRGLGLGAGLVRHAMHRAVESGFSRIALTTWGDDAELMAFYRRLGFQPIAECRIAPDPRLNAGTLYALLERPLSPAA